MESQQGLSFGTCLAAFVGGLAVGAGIVYLTAPRSGKETRKLLKDSTRHAQNQIKHLGPAVKSAYETGAEAAKSAMQEAYAAGRRELQKTT